MRHIKSSMRGVSYGRYFIGFTSTSPVYVNYCFYNWAESFEAFRLFGIMEHPLIFN